MQHAPTSPVLCEPPSRRFSVFHDGYAESPFKVVDNQLRYAVCELGTGSGAHRAADRVAARLNDEERDSDKLWRCLSCNASMGLLRGLCETCFETSV